MAAGGYGHLMPGAQRLTAERLDDYLDAADTARRLAALEA
jgi:hypothetical protein